MKFLKYFESVNEFEVGDYIQATSIASDFKDIIFKIIEVQWNGYRCVPIANVKDLDTTGYLDEDNIMTIWNEEVIKKLEPHEVDAILYNL
jgi:hypothetical protein